MFLRPALGDGLGDGHRVPDRPIVQDQYGHAARRRILRDLARKALRIHRQLFFLEVYACLGQQEP